MSAVTFMLCLALVAGGTYALFSDQVTLTTHLKAGTMDITLERTNLVTTALDGKTGFLVEEEDGELVDFSNPNDRNVFDLEENDKIVPGCSYDASMKITNNTDVAFAYWIEIVNRSSEELVLGDQVVVKVVREGYTAVVKINEGLSIGSQAKPIGVLAKTDFDEFNVVLEFLDLTTNNAAQNQSIDFDIVVHAVQVVDVPAPTPTPAP